MRYWYEPTKSSALYLHMGLHLHAAVVHLKFHTFKTREKKMTVTISRPRLRYDFVKMHTMYSSMFCTRKNKFAGEALKQMRFGQKRCAPDKKNNGDYFLMIYQISP